MATELTRLFRKNYICYFFSFLIQTFRYLRVFQCLVLKREILGNVPEIGKNKDFKNVHAVTFPYSLLRHVSSAM
jgi:hypothetical protein